MQDGSAVLVAGYLVCGEVKLDSPGADVGLRIIPVCGSGFTDGIGQICGALFGYTMSIWRACRTFEVSITLIVLRAGVAAAGRSVAICRL